MDLSKVLLPAPLVPTRAHLDWGSTLQSMSSRIWEDPRATETPSSVTAAPRASPRDKSSVYAGEVAADKGEDLAIARESKKAS